MPAARQACYHGNLIEWCARGASGVPWIWLHSSCWGGVSSKKTWQRKEGVNALGWVSISHHRAACSISPVCLCASTHNESSRKPPSCGQFAFSVGFFFFFGQISWIYIQYSRVSTDWILPLETERVMDKWKFNLRQHQTIQIILNKQKIQNHFNFNYHNCLNHQCILVPVT